jgi:hypothetical protein
MPDQVSGLKYNHCSVHSRLSIWNDYITTNIDDDGDDDSGGGNSSNS